MNKQQILPLLGKLSQHPATLAIVLAEMADRDLLSLDEIEIYARSTFARAYSKDAKSARVQEYDDRTVLRLESHREGYYDQLPQALFHRPRPRDSRDKAADRIKTYKETRAQEEAARNFFFPFEQDSLFFNIKLERNERRLINPTNSTLRRRMLLDIWPACKQLPGRFYPILSYILPLSYRVAGDLPLMETCYLAVCRARVKMRYVMIDDNEQLRANTKGDISIGAKLGVDTVMQGEPVAELPHLQIEIGPIPRRHTKDYLTGGDMQRVLAVLNDCLVPLDVTVVQKLVYEEPEELFALDEQAEKASYLGFTSTLNPTAVE